MTKKHLFSAALWMAGLTAFSKVLGLIRESALAAQFGANGITDAYKIAFSIPTIFFAILGAAITQAFIPVYSEYLHQKSGSERHYFLSNIVNWTMIITLLFMVPLLCFMPLVIKAIAPGFSQSTSAMAIRLALIILPSAAFIICTNMISAYLQCHGNFVTPSLIWIPNNAIIIISIFMGSFFGIEGVAWGSTIAFFSMIIIQLPALMKTGFKYQLVLDRNEAGLVRIIKLTVPVIIGVAFNQIYIVIDRILASGLAEGSITALDYANRVNSLALNIFISTVATVIFPTISSLSEDIVEFSKIVSKALNIMITLSFPIAISFIIMRTSIIKILFEHGVFHSNSTHITATALAGLSIGIIGVAFREVLNRAFYALKDTKTPMLNGIAVIVFQTVLCVVLVRKYGVLGLAVGTSVAALVSGGSLYYKLSKHLLLNNAKLTIANADKMAIAVIAFAGLQFLMNQQLSKILHIQSSTALTAVHVMLCGIVPLAVYLFALWIMRVDTIKDMIGLIKDRESKSVPTKLKEKHAK